MLIYYHWVISYQLKVLSLMDTNMLIPGNLGFESHHVIEFMLVSEFVVCLNVFGLKPHDKPVGLARDVRGCVKVLKDYCWSHSYQLKLLGLIVTIKYNSIVTSIHKQTYHIPAQCSESHTRYVVFLSWLCIG